MHNASGRAAIETLPSVPDTNPVRGATRRPVRIVFVVDNMGVGGSELNAVRTAEHLDRSRFDLRVVCFDVAGPLAERYRAIDVPVMYTPIGSLHGMQMLRAGRRFANYLRSERVDIVHSHDMYSNIFAVPWSRIARTPVTIASRRWWYSLPSAKLRLGNTVAFRMADAVLANSGQVARSVHSADGIREERIRIVSNFADDAAFAPLDACERDRRRKELGLQAGEIAIGCVARLVPVKDHAALIRAFRPVREACPDAKLVLVGDGPSREEIVALSSAQGVGEHVIVAGARTDGANYHHLFDISVLASRSEGFPNSLVEAMAAARPVVATAVGGNVDAVVDGETGRLVPAGAVEARAAALLELARSPELRARFGRAGHTRALQEYRADRAIATLEAMYDDLLRGRAA
jgi:glycosyltransferase involved in cell wall biosynthesis